jgi:neutral ceramidase
VKGKFNSISFFFEKNISDADHELLELAAFFQSPPGRPAASIPSVGRRVRSALRQDNKPAFVSAFCQSNCGDVSPNVLGAFCIDTGLPCDFNHSTCGGKNELCYGRGPGYLSLLPLRYFHFIFCFLFVA